MCDKGTKKNAETKTFDNFSYAGTCLQGQSKNPTKGPLEWALALCN